MIRKDDLHDLNLYKTWLSNNQVVSTERKSFFNAIEQLTALKNGNLKAAMPSRIYQEVLQQRATTCLKARKALAYEKCFQQYLKADKTTEGLAYRLSLYINSLPDSKTYSIVEKTFENMPSRTNVYRFASSETPIPESIRKQVHVILKNNGF
jgi:hypothetical protein